jgi:TfoX/Sxy family transcriptional regulator of competence genes
VAHDEGLAQRIREVLDEQAGLSEKRMFGGVAFLVHGNMAVGVVKSELMVRVGPEAHAAALREPHARPMDFTKRPMRGFVFVREEGLEDDAELARWIERGVRFAAALPPK